MIMKDCKNDTNCITVNNQKVTDNKQIANNFHEYFCANGDIQNSEEVTLSNSIFVSDVSEVEI